MADATFRRRDLIVGSLGFAAAALSGCTPHHTRARDHSELRYDKPAQLPDFPISDTPAWGSEQVGLGAIDDIIFSTDVAVIAGTAADESGVQMIKVVDAQTGKVRWSKERLRPLATSRPEIIHKVDLAVLDDGVDGLVLVHYILLGCPDGACAPGEEHDTDEQGVAALSLADGSVQWTHPIIPAVKAGTAKARKLKDHAVQVVSGLTRIGLAIIGPYDGVIGDKYADPGAIRTIALDPKTGTEAWSVKDAAAQRTHLDLVLATRPTQGPKGQSRVGTGGPMGLDVVTGEKVWDRSKDFTNSSLGASSGGTVMIQTVKEGPTTGQHLLSLADGATQLSFSATTPLMIGDDSSPLFASFSLRDANLVTLAPDEKAPIEAAHPPKDVSAIAAVHAGYLLASKRTDVPGKTVTVAFDRSGNELSDLIPGTVMKVNDTALVTRSRSGSGGVDEFSVFPLKP